MWLVILSMLCCLIVPSNAFAAVEDYETALMNPEQLYQYEYEPVYVEDNSVRSAPVLDENATTIDWVNSTVDSFNSVKVGSANMNFLDAVRAVLGNSSSGSTHSGQLRALYLVPAVGMVFLYWGVRKAIRMLFAAFRKSRASV